MFRIIQSIPSPKVEPLKRWLAMVGKERIDEIENPELSMDRMKTLHQRPFVTRMDRMHADNC